MERRPRLDPDVRRDRVFLFKMNARELRLLRDAAAAAHMTVSNFIRLSVTQAALSPTFLGRAAKPR